MRVLVFRCFRIRSSPYTPTYHPCKEAYTPLILADGSSLYLDNHMRPNKLVFECLGLNNPTIRCKSTYLDRRLPYSLRPLRPPQKQLPEKARVLVLIFYIYCLFEIA